MSVPTPDKDEDIADIMASVMGSAVEATGASAASPKHVPAPLPKSRQTKPTFRLKKRVRRVLIAAAGIFLLVLLVGCAVLLWNGPLVGLRFPSPFSAEVHKEVPETKLYYPTNLPSGYKIRKDSLRQPETGVIVYAVSSDNGSSVTISMQAKPEGLNLKPLYDTYEDLRELDTRVGKVFIGTSTEGVVLAHLVTDTTWTLINMKAGTLPSQEFDKLVTSLREG